MRKAYIRTSHIVVEIISFIVIITSIIYAIVKAASIEGDVPTHYNLAGEIDAYGSPYTLLILPIIMFVMLIVFSLVIHLVPARYWSLPFMVNPQRALLVYGDMIMMIAIMGLLTSIYTLFETMTFLDPERSSLGITFIYVGLLFLDIIVQCIRAKRHNG